MGPLTSPTPAPFSLPLGRFHHYQSNVQETLCLGGMVSWSPLGFTSFQSVELYSMCLGEMEPLAKEKVSY